jgi:hypothetical protein
MEYQSYPSYRYRDDENGQLLTVRVESPEDEAAKCPADEQWRHSPNPDAKPSVDPNTLAMSGVGGSGMFEAYPSYRYRKNEQGELETRRVENADDDAENCPDEDGWTDSPSGLAASEAPSGPVPVSTSVPKDLNAPSDPPNPERDAQDAAEMHAMKQRDVVAMVVQMQNQELLIRAHRLESANPSAKGGRVAVINAINSRMNELVEAAQKAASA